MGPRLFSRGKVGPKEPWVKPAFRLQWGRGFSAAERLIKILNEMVPILTLQWGRGFSAAESAEAPAHDPKLGGRFNGAAAFQPRKGGSHGRRESGNFTCFNGAAAFPPRKGPLRKR